MIGYEAYFVKWDFGDVSGKKRKVYGIFY